VKKGREEGSVVDPDPVGSGPFGSYPDPEFSFQTGSGSGPGFNLFFYTTVILKQFQTMQIFSVELKASYTVFLSTIIFAQGAFSDYVSNFFIHPVMLQAGSGSGSGLKLVGWIRIRSKMDQIRNTGGRGRHEGKREKAEKTKTRRDEGKR